MHPEERGEIYTNGYISRSIMMSSRGQSSVQSALDLQFYGEIAPFQIEGNLNDKNLPVQPEGTSARLQEIDRVYITLKKIISSLHSAISIFIVPKMQCYLNIHVSFKELVFLILVKLKNILSIMEGW